MAGSFFRLVKDIVNASSDHHSRSSGGSSSSSTPSDNDKRIAAFGSYAKSQADKVAGLVRQSEDANRRGDHAARERLLDEANREEDKIRF